MSTWSLRLFPRRNRVRWQALTDEELYLTMKGKTILHLRRISIALLLGGSALGAILVGAVTHTFAAGNASNASVITGVVFTGTSDQPGPTVTVTGHSNPFGHNPPTGHDNSTTNCGPTKTMVMIMAQRSISSTKEGFGRLVPVYLPLETASGSLCCHGSQTRWSSSSGAPTGPLTTGLPGRATGST